MALLLSLLNTKIAIVASSIKTSSAAELAKALCEVELEKLTTDVVEKLLTLCPVSEAEVKQCREYVRAPPRELGGGTLGHLHPRGSAGPGTCILKCGAGWCVAGTRVTWTSSTARSASSSTSRRSAVCRTHAHAHPQHVHRLVSSTRMCVGVGVQGGEGLTRRDTRAGLEGRLRCVHFQQHFKEWRPGVATSMTATRGGERVRKAGG